MLVTGLALKHCNHPNQMESYHRSYENKTNSFFKSQTWCLFLISLIVDLSNVKQNLFFKSQQVCLVQNVSDIFPKKLKKGICFFQGKSLYRLVCSKHSDSGKTFYFLPKINWVGPAREQQPIFICSLFLIEPEINLVQGKQKLR